MIYINLFIVDKLLVIKYEVSGELKKSKTKLKKKLSKMGAFSEK